jgi:hypothetical protein
MPTEKPVYEAIKDYDGFQLRRYKQQLVAETEVVSGFEQAGNEAFGTLADFIFGNNSQKVKIAMTVPVTQAKTSTRDVRDAETAPATEAQRRAGSGQGSYLVSFLMPSQFDLETLPEPVNSRVRVRTVEERWVAVRPYRGGWSEPNFRMHSVALLEAVKAAGLHARGLPIFARYDSPIVPWFLRRNEVWVEVDAPLTT